MAESELTLVSPTSQLRVLSIEVLGAWGWTEGCMYVCACWGEMPGQGSLRFFWVTQGHVTL